MALRTQPHAEELREGRLEARTPPIQRQGAHSLRWAFPASLASLIVFLLVCFGQAALQRLGPPDLSRYHDRSLVVTDRSGRMLRGYLSGDESWRFAVAPGEVSPLYLAMLEAYEDRRFERHGGVDPLALLRAGGQALAQGRIVSGASTLTMQAARLLEPRPRGLAAKLIEMVRAVQLERRFSKDQIRAIYLTLAPFGGNLEGLRAASLAYFNKEPGWLGPAEAALLVVLPQSPNRLRPDRYPARARAARNKVLERAAKAGIITERTAEEAKAAALPIARRPLPFLAPHLADRLRRAHPGEERIETTIDATLQTALEALSGDAARALDPAAGIAALIVDNRSLEIRAHAGAPDYFSERRQGMIDMTRAVRSPGSALKPFIYGLAFDDLAAHPDSLIRDAPSRFGSYAPRNYDRGFAGDVTLREALQLSLNIPAVALLARVGPLRFERRLTGAGASLRSSAQGARPSLALALGGVGITLEDLVGLYAAVPNGGGAGPLRVTADAPQGPPSPLMGPVAAWYLADVLAGTPRPSGFLDTSLGGRDGRTRIAFKTGTSYGQRDAWAIGFTDRFTIGIWVGRPDGAPCAGCVGLQAAAPILFRAFALLPEAGRSPAATAAPAGALSGPTANLPPGLRRIGPEPEDHLARRNSSPPPQIAFPLEDATLAMANGGPYAVPLKAQGGKRPYRWLADGRPLGGPVWRQDSHWQPQAPGFTRLQLVDAEGRSARIDVQVTETVE